MHYFNPDNYYFYSPLNTLKCSVILKIELIIYNFFSAAMTHAIAPEPGQEHENQFSNGSQNYPYPIQFYQNQSYQNPDNPYENPPPYSLIDENQVLNSHYVNANENPPGSPAGMPMSSTQ